MNTPAMLQGRAVARKFISVAYGEIVGINTYFAVPANRLHLQSVFPVNKSLSYLTRMFRNFLGQLIPKKSIIGDIYA